MNYGCACYSSVRYIDIVDLIKYPPVFEYQIPYAGLAYGDVRIRYRDET